MIVNVEEIIALQKRREEINDIRDLSEIEFYENGVKLEFDEHILEEWDYTGLNNTEFIASGAYKSVGSIFNKV